MKILKFIGSLLTIVFTIISLGILASAFVYLFLYGYNLF